MLITKGKTEITPLEAGYDEKRLDVLHRHFERLISGNKIMCASYCASRKGKVFAAGAIGPLRYDDPEKPLLPDAVNRIASITKLTATVAVMKLIEDGFFRLDTPVKELLPEFDFGDFWKINVYHLLTHTSGMIPDQGYDDLPERDYWACIDEYIQSYDPKKDGDFRWLSAALKAGVRRAPDAEWQYCSFGFAVLGEIISRVSGVHANKYIEDEILKPLGMRDSVFDLTPALAARSIAANERQKKYLDAVAAGQAGEDKSSEYWDKIPSTGGGLFSTLYDLVKFGNLCLNMGTLGGERILGRKIFEKITTRALFGKPNFAWNVNDPDRAYGIGFDMKNGEYIYSPGSFFHEGAGACALFIDPKEEMVAAYFVPEANGWNAESVYNTQIILWSGLI
ncbi:MAG: beta-lactamase family protein [Oscillospiraceae bacterium]|jgi:CubicO group peptidase (beta-lactamase class C family)|nr:beta-lactamase family protein [Oscillospiraceae bacterium]